jgi:hypothetical protein
MEYDETERFATFMTGDIIADILRRGHHFALNEKEVLLHAMTSYVSSIHPNDRGTANKIIHALKGIE